MRTQIKCERLVLNSYPLYLVYFCGLVVQLNVLMKIYHVQTQRINVRINRRTTIKEPRLKNHDHDLKFPWFHIDIDSHKPIKLSLI